MTLLKAIYHDIVMVHQPKVIPLTALTIDQILRYGSCTGCVLPPSLIEDMLPTDEFFDTLASLDFVQFGSGPMSKAAGDKLLKRQKTCPHFIGSSEAGLLTLLELEDPVLDWQYFHFHPWSGVDMCPVDEGAPTVWQLFVMRLGDVMGLQPVFELFTGLKEWDTRELYTRHPTKPYLWRCIERVDDIIVLSNGEKLNPSEMEATLSNCLPTVKGALVVGSGRFMPGLLLEVTCEDPHNTEHRSKLLDGLRPTLQAVNARAPKHGQLLESMIHFTTESKPFLRTPKLSIRRQKTVEAFEMEISQMYDRFEAQSVEDILLPRNFNWQSEKGIQDFFVSIILSCTDWKKAPHPHEDLFLLGLDSLHVMRLVRATRAALIRQANVDTTLFDSRIVYNNLSVEKLSKALKALLSHQPAENIMGKGSGASIEQHMDHLVDTHTEFDLDRVKLVKKQPTTLIGATVILTGSTGSFGTYLLPALMNNSNVRRIYCLDRSSDAKARHIDSFSLQGLQTNTTLLDEKVVFLQTTDLSRLHLGLDQHRYDTLRHTVTYVLHNSWPVNFNLSLDSFEPHIKGVRKRVDFCLSAKNHCTLAFVSSVSSVASRSGTIPAAVVQDSSAAGNMGYAQSKDISERILDTAMASFMSLSNPREATFKPIILRVGHIAGPVAGRHGEGMWAKREWFPRLVLSSRLIDAIPETLGRMETVEWIPVDLLAKIVCELMGFSDNGDSTQQDMPQHAEVHNLINPTGITGNHLLAVVKEHMAHRKRCAAVGVDRTSSAVASRGRYSSCQDH